eukprot:1144456-Amphidinium_carterae.1
MHKLEICAPSVREQLKMFPRQTCHPNAYFDTLGHTMHGDDVGGMLLVLLQCHALRHVRSPPGEKTSAKHWMRQAQCTPEPPLAPTGDRCQHGN